MSLSSYAQEGMLQGVEEVLVANPDDLFTHRAYANLLLQDRDPAAAARGRLVEAQLRLEQGGCPEAERKKLERRGRKLLKDHGRAWLGELAPHLLDGQGLEAGEYRFELARGWLDSVIAPALCPDFIRALARAPQARLLRKLVIEETAPGGCAALAPLLGAPYLARLRVFRLGPCGGGSGGRDAGADVVAELVARLTNVAELFTPWHQPKPAGAGH